MQRKAQAFCNKNRRQMIACLLQNAKPRTMAQKVNQQKPTANKTQNEFNV